jgi:hypothetical protein
MPELLYALPILLLLILGAIQFGLIYQAKLTLNYAAYVGAREGALRHGSMAAILDGVQAGMAPLYTKEQSMAGLKAARAAANAIFTEPLLSRVSIVNPTPAAFSTFQDTQSYANKVAGTTIAEIPNDNLMYRDPTQLGDGMNIQDANLLKIHVRMCYRMFVPIVNRMIFALAVSKTDSGLNSGRTGSDILRSYESGAANPATRLPNCYNRPAAQADEYFIPIESEAVIRMQSAFRQPGSPATASNWYAPQ